MHRHYNLKLTTTVSHNEYPGIYTYHENIMKQPESTTDGYIGTDEKFYITVIDITQRLKKYSRS